MYSYIFIAFEPGVYARIAKVAIATVARLQRATIARRKRAIAKLQSATHTLSQIARKFLKKMQGCANCKGFQQKVAKFRKIEISDCEHPYTNTNIHLITYPKQQYK